jgi:thiol-disulfide isomerase/thioredoxin
VYFDDSWRVTTTDLEGRFSYDHVPPGEWKLYRVCIVSEDSRQHEPDMGVPIAPGGVTRVVYGGLGRPVVGRVVVNDPAVPITPGLLRQNHFETATDEATSGVSRKETDGARASDLDQRGARLSEVWFIGFETNGSFRLDNVKSGTYELYIGLKDTDPNARELRGQVRMKVHVPEIAGGVSDEPLDLGTLTIDVHPEERVELGDFGEAPDFDLLTSDGGRVTLHSQRGKCVLLDFWATWCGPCIREIPYLKEVHDAFGRSPRLVLVGVNIDEKEDTWRKAVAAHKLEWTQGYAGPPKEGGVTSKYAVDGYPAIFLINPEGRIIARNLRGKSTFAAVNKALKAARGHAGE